MLTIKIKELLKSNDFETQLLGFELLKQHSNYSKIKGLTKILTDIRSYKDKPFPTSIETLAEHIQEVLRYSQDNYHKVIIIYSIIQIVKILDFHSIDI